MSKSRPLSYSFSSLGRAIGAVVVLALALGAQTASAAVNEWTWVSGSNIADQPGVYGVQGEPSPANHPGARHSAVSWTDPSGSLWLFGGYGYATTLSLGDLNDLWKWDGTNWTWVSGSDVPNQVGVYGVQGEPGPANHPGARSAAVSWTDPSGNMWLFGGGGYTSSGEGLLNDLWKWDGANWTWVSGSDTLNQTGVYGVQGEPDPDNLPGARLGAVSGVDADGNLWLFGGGGYTSSGEGLLNDLWKWDGANWTWVSGSDAIDQASVYGTQGVADPANHPGARRNAVLWTDASGDVWLFGGVYHTPFYKLNDLWKWDGTNWTWVSGSDTLNQPGVYGVRGSPAPGNYPGARDSATSWVDASGDVWVFGGVGYAASGGGDLNDLWKWDGANWTWVSGSDTANQTGVYGVQGSPAPGNYPGARGFSVSWTDASGDMWLFGGFGYASTSDGDRLNDFWKFDIPPSYTLTVAGSGDGSGSMTDGGSISCAWDGISTTGSCDHTAVSGTSHTLTAAADPGSTFTGWSGCDPASPAGTCLITPTGDATVTATFNLLPCPLANCSFESPIGANKFPGKWRRSGLTLPGDGTDRTTFTDGAQSFRFRGNGTLKKLYQDVAISGPSGDQFNLTFSWRGNKVTGKTGLFRVMAVLYYTDGTSKKFYVNMPIGSNGWTDYSLPFTATKPYNKLRVEIDFGKKGVARFDDFGLTIH